MSGYTGTARRGHSLQDFGHGRTKLEGVTLPCPECRRPSRFEVFTLNGKPAGQIVCASYRYSKRKGLTTGCIPKRIEGEELEIIMKTKQEAKSAEFLTDEDIWEIRRMADGVRLNIGKLSIACGWPRLKLYTLLHRRQKMTHEDWARLREIVDLEKRKILETSGTEPAPVSSGRTRSLELISERVDELGEQENIFQEEIKDLNSRLGDLQNGIKTMHEEFLSVHCQLWERAGEHGDRIERLEKIAAGGTFTVESAAADLPEFPESWGSLRVVENPENCADLMRSFLNFERICRNMARKCPHLYAAVIKRAQEVAF